MATYNGLPCCSCLAAWIPPFVAELARHGVKVRFTQLNGNYGPSAGTHAGGAFDLVVTSGSYSTAVGIARKMGADATWERPQNWDGRGGIRHIHGLLNGCPHLSAPARSQQGAVRGNRNGLANNGRDTGPRPLSGRSWRQGIAWAKAQEPKPRSERIGTWNVALIIKRARLSDRIRRIRAKVKTVKLDVLGVQEAPSSGDGKHLKGTLIGRDGKPMKRVGKYARYLFFVSGTKIHGWATWNPWPTHKTITKYVTTACATIPGGHKRLYVNCHPISGEQYAAHREKWAKAVIVKAIRRARNQGLGPEDVIFLGDFNGAEFARVAAGYGYVRARSHAKVKGAVRRTYNAFGKRTRVEAGGEFDYILVHKSKRSLVERATTFWTWLASDHNLTIIEIKE